jgi:hypothetical protein
MIDRFSRPPSNSNRYHSKAIPFIFVTLIAALIIDRAYWCWVTQWREDQGTNLWLGYTQPLSRLPVGLVSSTRIPNVNGMLILGKAFSLLPSLWSVSMVLSLIQAAGVVLFCRVLFYRKGLAVTGSLGFWTALIPLSCSVLMRGCSTEFWNNWVFISVDLFFVFLLLRNLERPGGWNWTFAFALCALSPSLYLAGLVNAVVFSAVWLGVFVLFGADFGAPDAKLKNSRMKSLPIAAILAVFSFWFLFSWLPYLQSTDLSRLRYASSVPLHTRFNEAIFAVASIPMSFLYWTRGALEPILQRNSDINPPWVFQAMRASDLVFRVAMIASFVTAVVLLLFRKARIDRKWVIVLVFVVLAYGVNPLLGGFFWHRGERLDQSVQFLPFILALAFATPFLLNETSPSAPLLRTLRAGAFTASCIYGISQLVIGWGIVQAHLAYRGTVISDSDVTLRDKVDALKWIVQDHRTQGTSREIALLYAFEGGLWDWVDDFGQNVLQWYPSAPLTTGRSLDFELLRHYGIRNHFEGIQLRNSRAGEAEYVLSYACRPIPAAQLNRGVNQTHVFGRIRVASLLPVPKAVAADTRP